MGHHFEAKRMLFNEIGMNIGVFEDYDKYRSDMSNSKTNEGTNLLKAIDDAWREIVMSGRSSTPIDWNSILTQSRNQSITLEDVSKIIAKNVFKDAFTDKLQSIVYDGVIRSSRELKRIRHVT